MGRISKGPMSERRKRGFLMLAVGAIMMLTYFAGLDMVFVAAGGIFAALGLGDIVYDGRYKRRF